MCAFEGIPRQALYGSSVKSKAQGGLFLTHRGYISSSRENKVQPLRMTATDNRYYQTRNRRVGCKSKQHNVQWKREGMGAIKVLFIYIFIHSRQMVLASENLSSSKCQISLLSKVGCWHIISHPSISLPLWTSWQSLPAPVKAVTEDSILSAVAREDNKVREWKCVSDRRLTDATSDKRVERVFTVNHAKLGSPFVPC